MKKMTRSAALAAAGVIAAVGISLVPGAAQADTGWPTMQQKSPASPGSVIGVVTIDVGGTVVLSRERTRFRPLDTGWPT